MDSVLYAVVVTEEDRVYTVSSMDIYPPDWAQLTNQSKPTGPVRVFLQTSDQIINGRLVFLSGK